MSDITFRVGGKDVIRIDSDGFWVDGKKVDVAKDEARIVFDAMYRFLESSGHLKQDMTSSPRKRGGLQARSIQDEWSVSRVELP